MNEKHNTELIAPRYQTREPARIDIYGKKEVLFCQMNNLSASGAFFEIISSTYTPRIGDLVHVTISLKKMNKVHKVSGEIIWSKGFGLGVSFIKQKELFARLTK